MSGKKPRKPQKGGKKGDAVQKKPAEPKEKPPEAAPQQPKRESVETPRQPKDRPREAVPQQPRKTQKEYQRAASAPGAADRDRLDPIIKVSFVVFLLASLVVVGATVYDKNFSAGDTREVAFGDTLMVEYTGAINGYYDENGVIFDTNVKSHYDNDDYAKAVGYERDKFDLLEVKMTDPPNVITPFRDALFGKKVGETVRLQAPAEQAYPTNAGGPIEVSRTITIPITMGGLTKAKADAYLKDAPATIENGERLATIFGWDALVYKDGNYYTLSHLAVKTADGEPGHEYSEDVNVKVNSVAGNEITFEYVLTEKGDAQIDRGVGVKMFIDGEERIVVDYDDTKLRYKAKLSDDALLYFVVKIVEFKE
ncbi:MAG: hypothetical protein GX224_02340 [Thermoplasmatales archaeon]|nr:hypothetical protein [Thermoplasmatales archaeon]